MKKYFFLATLLCTFFISYGQEAKTYKNTISGDPLALLGRTVSLSYSREIHPSRIEFIFNARYQPRIASTINFLVTPGPHDPVHLYENISLNTGLRKIFRKPFYIEALLLMKYGSYYNIKFEKYVDKEGEAEDVDYIISRQHKMIGGIFNGGYIYEKNRFRMNMYIGIGYRYQWTDEQIMDKTYWQGLQKPVEHFPIRSSYFKDFVTPHTGIELGFRF